MSKTKVVSKKNKGVKTRTRKSRVKKGGDEQNNNIDGVNSESYIFGGGLLLVIGLGILGFSSTSGSSSSHKTVL